MDEYCVGGITLRSLLEKRDLLALHPRAEITGKEYKPSGDPYSDAAAAFLGPNLWDKTLSDFKLEYLDLDDLLGSQNNNTNGESNQKFTDNNNMHCNQGNSLSSVHHLTAPKESSHAALQFQGVDAYNAQHSSRPQSLIVTPPSSPVRIPSCSGQADTAHSEPFDAESKFSPNDLALATPPGEDNFNPASVSLQDDDLKPQPMMKKSQKHFVPDDLKDDRYWARRRKNNLAAKRSREARRIKENQIVLRASYLEKENNNLKEDVMRLKAENDMLRSQLKKLKH